MAYGDQSGLKVLNGQGLKLYPALLKACGMSFMRWISTVIPGLRRLRQGLGSKFSLVPDSFFVPGHDQEEATIPNRALRLDLVAE